MSEVYNGLLPPNATEEERAIEATGAVATDTLSLPENQPMRPVWQPDLCPAPLLPYLAWALSVDEWDPAWPETTKRLAVKDALGQHLIKGSVQSLRNLLGLLGFPDAVLTEWFETPVDPGLAAFHSDTPHTFSLGFNPEDTEALFDPAFITRLTSQLAHTVPVRSHICLYVDFRSENTRALAPVSSGATELTDLVCLERGTLPIAEGLGEAHIGTATAVLTFTLEF